jgi:hypothetical protein
MGTPILDQILPLAGAIPPVVKSRSTQIALSH